MIQKVLIVGATGFCGSAVVKALLQHPNFHPIAHIRNNTSRIHQIQHFKETGIEVLHLSWNGLLDQLPQIQPDIICSFLGTTQNEMKQFGGDYHSIDYELNHQLLQASMQLPNVPTWLYLSSSGAQWGKWNRYLNARWLFEQELEQANLPFIILRPKLLTGKSRDPKRPMEEWSNRLLQRLSDLCEQMGLSGIADNIRPLDAPDIAQIIIHILNKLDIQHKDSTHPILELKELHQIRKQLQSLP